MIIVINAVCIGVETDGHGSFDTWMVTESIFNVIFAVEVIAKLFGFGLLYFTDTWNIADLVTVVFSWVEVVHVWHITRMTRTAPYMSALLSSVWFGSCGLFGS